MQKFIALIVLSLAGCGGSVRVTAATTADGEAFPYCLAVKQPIPVNPLANRLEILFCANAIEEVQQKQAEYAKRYPQATLAIVRGREVKQQ